jgi:HTH-type transcriptional regulator/antitoxin HipB
MIQIARNAQQIGATIRRRRRGAKLSQAELSAKTGLRQATISALEAGGVGVRLGTLVDVMAALGLELVIRDRSTAPKSIEELF